MRSGACWLDADFRLRDVTHVAIDLAFTGSQAKEDSGSAAVADYPCRSREIPAQPYPSADRLIIWLRSHA